MNYQPESTLVFLDTNVPDYQQLMDGVHPQADVVLIDSSKDGVEAITRELGKRQNLSNIQILSHGSQGALNLGATQLDAGNLQDYSGQLQQWRGALAPGGDILLYGCNVASGSEGKSFVEELSRIIGLDVAASDDLTGNSLLGGDWDFEFKTGEIEARSAVVPEVRDSFDGVLNREGLVQTYYDSNGGDRRIENTNKVVDYQDTKITDNWGGGKPSGAKGDSDIWNAYWDGYFVPPQEGDYTFWFKADDSVRFQIDLNRDGSFSSDEDSGWKQHSSSWKSISSKLTANQAYQTKVSYYEAKGDASIDFTVSGPGRGDSSNLSGLFVPYKPPMLSITPLDSQSSERSGYAQFQLTADRTAPYDIDVKTDRGTFRLPSNNSSTTIKVEITDDDKYETSDKQTLNLEPGNPSYLLGSNTTATAEIIDNDMKVSLEGGGATLKETEEGETTLTLKISDGGFQEETTVTLETNGTSDIKFDPITVQPGQTSVDIPVTAVNDTLAEINDENFQISVADSSSYQLGDSTSVNITVEDNEPEIGISFTSNATGTVEEADAKGEFTIDFTKVNPQEFDLKFKIEGTAKHGTVKSPPADSDYQLVYDALDENGNNLNTASLSLDPGTDKLKVPANTLTIKLRVEPINNELWEPDETVTITLLDNADSTSSDKQYYKIDSNKETATLTIKDNEPTVSLGKVVMPEEGFGFGSTIQELGKAIALDGKGYISVAESDKLDLSATGKFTQEAWVYGTGNGNQTLFGDAAYQTNNQKAYPRLWTTEKQGVKAGFGDGETYHELSSPDNVLNPDSWNHLAATFDGKDYKIYVNGVEIVSEDEYKGKKLNNSQQFDIGRNGDSNYFQGAIDEVRLWNVARTPGEIQNAMLTPLTGQETGLIGYWNFESNTNDSSGNDNHGTYVDDSLFTTVDNGNNESQFIDSQANPNGKNLGKTLYFAGSGERQATTRAFDTTVTGNITFDLIFSNGSNGGEAADAGKDVVLEYSTDDGNNWRQLAIYDTENYGKWTTIQETIPEDARTTKSQFRWRQLELDNSTGDNWGLANVQVANYINNPAPQIGYIEVNLDKPFEWPQGLWVNYDIDGTAKQNEDYFNSRYRKESTDANSERDGIIIPQGETSSRIYIVASPDEIDEADEEVNITLKPHNFDGKAGSSSDTNTNYRVDAENKTRKVTIADNGAYEAKAIFLDRYDRPIDESNNLYVDANGQATIKVKLASQFSNNNGDVTVTVGETNINFNSTNWDKPQTITLDGLTTSSPLSYSYSNQDGNQRGSLKLTNTAPKLIQTTEGSTADLIPVTPEVSINKGRDVREGDNQPGEFVVNLTAPAPEKLEVQYTVESTTTTKEDYEELPASITVEAGETQAVLPVAAVDDNTSEDKETVEVALVYITGEEFKVNTYTDDNQQKPVVAALSNGGFVIIWESEGQDSSSSLGVYGQRYDAEGKKLGKEFQINTHADNNQSNSAITALSNGGFVVTWHSEGQDGSDYGIYGQRYDSNGSKVGDEFQVNTTTSNNQSNSAITALPDEGFVITWHSEGQDGSNDGIYGQRYDSNGSKVGDEFQVNTTTSNNQSNSAITALPDEGFVITWHSEGQDSSDYGIYGQRYDSNGSKVGDEFQVNTTTSNNQSNSAITALSNGGFVVTWHSEGQDSSDYGIYGQRYDSNGSKVGDEFQVNTTTSNNQSNSAITALSNGGFVVTWHSEGQDSSDYGIYGQRYDSNGSKVENEFQINTHADNNQSNSAITALSNGSFVVTWHSEGQDGSGKGIYGQRYQGTYIVDPESDRATVEITDNDNTNIELANKVESRDGETITYTSTFTPVNTSEKDTSEKGTPETVGVRLPSRPSADVTVTLSNPDTTEGEVTPTNLTFTPNNWDEYQDVTVTGKPDSESDGDVEYKITVKAESKDINYQDKTTVIPVTNTDENANIELANKVNSTTVGVRLPRLPSANVTLKLSNPDTTEGEVTPSELKFTPGNWDEYQDVTLTGQPDSESDGDVKYKIAVEAESDDVNYKDKTTEISLNDTSKDTSIALVNQLNPYTLSLNEVTTSEDGTSETVGIRLPYPPTANVTVELSNSDTTEGEVTPTNLTFTPNNWDKYQDVKITGKPDPESDEDVKDVKYNIDVKATSEDPKYDNQKTAIAVINTDTDGTGETEEFKKPTASVKVIEQMTETKAGKVEISLSEPVAEGETVKVQFSANDDDNAATEGEDYKLGNKLFINSIADDNKTQLFDNPFGEESPGNAAKPTFGDVDGDGDTDAVVGIADGTIKYFENPGIGNLQARIGVNNPFNSVKVSSNATPALADLNGDGKLDLVVGEGNGNLSYFANKSNSTTTLFLSVDAIADLANPFRGIKANINSAPTFGDLNGDRLPDLVLGAADGSVTYYFNEGTTTKPLFKSNSGSEISNLGNNAMPQLIDWDLDNDLDIIASNGKGEIKYLQNSDASNPEFTLTNGKPLPGISVDGNSALAFADLDEDGDTDAFIGTPDKGIEYVEQFQAVTFKAGEQTKEVTIQPIQDLVDEGEGESFKFSLESGINENNGYEVDGESYQVELTIGDDDTAGVTVTPKQTEKITSEPKKSSPETEKNLSETDQSLAYTAKLNTKPTDVVQVFFGSNDDTEALLGTSKSNKVELEVDNGNNSNQFSANKDALFFTGNGTRQATTQELNATNIDKVTFDLIFGNDTNGGADAEDGKDVILEYSSNGGSNWSFIARYDTEEYAEWTTIEEEIPQEARTPKTQLRWRQVNANSPDGDNWGLAKVEIPIAQKAEVIQLEFTPDNWDKPQEFFVSGVDDDIDDNNVPYKIITTVQGEDSQYRGLEVDPIQLTNNHRGDEAKVEITKITDGVAEGRENIYKVKISTQPTGEVRIIADPQNDQIRLNDEDYGDRLTLTFDETNWNVEQVVRVSAFDDNLVEFIHESQIEFEVESGEYKDFESKAVNDTAKEAIDLGEIQGGYTWKNLGVTGEDRDWFKFTLTDAATTEDFVRVNITEGNKENLKFNIYKGDDFKNAVKTSSSEVKLDGLERGEYYLEVFSPKKSNIEYDFAIGDEGYKYEALENGPLDVQIIDDDLPTAKIISGPTAAELSSTPAYFTIKLNAPLPDKNGSTGLKVNYEIVGGTATLQTDNQLGDYKVTNKNSTQKGFVRIAPGEAQNNVLIVPIDDKLVEDLELNITNVAKDNSSNGKTTLNLDVEIPSDNDATIEEIVKGSTLRFSDDISGTVSSNGKFQKIESALKTTIEVEVDDEDADKIAADTKAKVAGETVKVKLLEGEGYQIQEENTEETEATLVIQDDDTPGVRIVQVGENTTVAEEETATFAVSLLSEPTKPVTLKLTPGAEMEFVDPVAPTEVEVEKTTYSFATPEPKVNGQAFDIKLNSLVNTDRGDAVAFDIKLKEKPSQNVTVKIYDANDADPTDLSRPLEEITFSSDQTAVVNQVTGEKKPSNWNELRKVNLYELDRDSNGNYKLILEVNGEKQEVAIDSKVEKVKKETTSITIQPEDWFKLQTVTVSGSQDLVSEPGLFHNTSIQYEVTSTDDDYNEIFVPNQTIEVVDRVLNAKETAQGMKEGLGLLQNSIDELSLPLVGKLKGKNPNIIGDLSNSLAKDTESQSQLTSQRLKETIENVLSDLRLEFFNVTTEVNEEETIVNLNLSKQLEHLLPLDANLGIPALGLQTEGALRGAFNFDLSLTFGIHKNFGFYLDTKKTFLDTGIKVDLKDFKGRGGLGFLALDFADDKDNPTALEVSFKATLNDVDDIQKATSVQTRSLTSDSGTVIDVPASTLDEEFLDRISSEDYSKEAFSLENDEILAEKIAAEEAAIEKALEEEVESDRPQTEETSEEEETVAAGETVEEEEEEVESDGLQTEETSEEEETVAAGETVEEEEEEVESDGLQTEETSEEEETVAAGETVEEEEVESDGPQTEETSEEEETVAVGETVEEEEELETAIEEETTRKQPAAKLETAETEELEEEEATGNKGSEKRQKSNSKTAAKLETAETEELEEEEATGKQSQNEKKSKGQTATSPETEEEQSEGIAGKQSQNKKNKKQKTAESSTTPETDEEATQESQTSRSLIQRRNGTTTSTKTLTGDELTQRLSELGISELSVTLPTDAKVQLASTDDGYKLAIDNFNLKALVKEITTIELPIDLEITGAELNVTQTTKDGQKVNSYDIKGKVNGAEATYKDLENGGYEVKIGKFDLKDFVQKATTVELPIDLKIDDAKFNIKDVNGEKSYDLSGTFNGADVSYKDLENGGYEVKIGKFDLKDFVQKATTVELPIDLKIDDAKFNIKDVNGEKSYDLSGTFNGADVSYKDLADDGYEVKIGKFDLKDFVQKATTVELPIDLKIDDAKFNIKDVNGEKSYDLSGTFNGADVSYKDLADDGYEVKIGKFDLKDFVQKATTVELPIDLKIDDAKFNIKDVNGEKSYDLSGTFNGADVSYKDLADDGYEVKIGKFDLKDFVQKATTVELPIDLKIDDAKFNIKDVNGEKSYDLSGTFNGAEVSYKDLADDGYEVKIGKFDLKDFVQKATTVELPIDLKIDDAKFNIKDVNGEKSYDLSGTFNGAEVSYKDLADDGYEVKIGKFDLKDFVQKATTVELPIDLKIDDAKFNIKDVNGEKSYDLSGTFNGAEVSYKDLADDGYEVKIGKFDLKDFVQKATTVELPVDLEISDAKFNITKDDGKASYDISGTFNGADVSYKDLENDGYELTLDKFDLKDFVEKATKVELPIDAKIDDAVLKVTKGTNAQGETVNNYDITGKIGDATVAYKDLENGGYEAKLDDFDLKKFVLDTTKVELPIDAKIDDAVLKVTKGTKDGKEVNLYDITGKIGDATVAYKDLENGGYEAKLDDFDLKKFVLDTTTVELPIDAKIDDAVLKVTKGTKDGKEVNLYDITGKIGDATVAYKDLENGGYEAKLDDFDLKKFVLDTTTVELPIDAKIDDAVLKVTKVTNAQGETVNNYDITGKIGNAKITYKDLPDNQYEFTIDDFPVGDVANFMENELGINNIGNLATGDVDLSLKPNEKSIAFDGNVDLSALVKAAANDPKLPIPSLSLDSPSLSYIKDDSETKYSFTFGDESSISYTKKSNNDYDFIVDNFPIGDLSKWIETDLGISGASKVFTGNLDVEISPNTKEIAFDGKVDIGKLIQPLVGYKDISWEVENPILSYNKTFGGATEYKFSDRNQLLSYTKDAEGKTTFIADNFEVGAIAGVVTSGLGLDGKLPENWKNLKVDATISPTEKSLSIDGEVSVKDFAELVKLRLPEGFNLSLINPSLSVKGTDNNKSFDFSGTGKLTLPKESFGDFTEIANLLPGLDATDSGLEISGDIAVSKSSSGDIGLQLGVPVLGAIRLERKENKWKFAAIEDGDRLTIADLGVVATNDEYSFTDLINYEFKGEANLGLKAEASVQGNPAFPSFSVDIAGKLPLFNYGSQEEAGKEGFSFEFNNMELNLGSFLSDFAKPIVVEVDRIIDPIKPIVKAINADTKFLSKLGLESTFDSDGEPGVSILEFAGAVSKLTGSSSKEIQTAIKFAKTIGDIVETVDVLSKDPGDVIIPLGSYSLTDLKAASEDEADSASNQTPTKDERQNRNSQTTNTPLEEAKTNQAYSKLSSLEGIEIPLISSPINAVYLFLGKDVDLIKYDVPDIEFGTSYNQSFPIYTPPTISGELGASIKVKTDLAFGFDTKGINEWKNKYDFDPTKAYLVFDGLYLDDLDKNGKDKNELTVEGDIYAGLGLSAGVVKGVLKGGINASVGLDIEDVGEKTGKSDGKVRGSEIISRISNPLSLFELNGKIDAYLKGEVRVGIDLGIKEIMKTVWEIELGRFNLAEFSVSKSGSSASALGGKYSTSYIAGATVFLDANLNGLLDDNEPVTGTDSNGDYNLEFDLEYYDANGNGQLDEEEGQIITIGGIDTSSGVSITTQMVNSVEYSILTPLTNLENFLVQGEYVTSTKAAEKLIVEKLDLPKAGSLANNDPIADIVGGEKQAVQKAGVEFYLAHVQLQNLVVHANALLQGANPKLDSLEKVVTAGLAGAFTSDKASFDLSNASDVEAILTQVATESTKSVTPNGEGKEGSPGKEISAEIIQAAAKMVAEANALVDEMAAEAGEKTLDLVMPVVAPVKRTTQGQLADITEKLAAEKLTPEDAQEQFTTDLEAGNRLEPQIISDTRNVKVSATGDLDENGDESIEIVIELGEQAPSQGVNILYNISGSATQGEDYEISGLSGDGVGTIYIEPEATTKTLTVSALNDEEGEGTETLTLNLRYAGEGYVIDSELQAAIVNILDDETTDNADNNSRMVDEGTIDEDTISGSEGNDSLSGSYAADFIEGKEGSDILKGNYGNDTIAGGEGADIIEGNYDNDFLTGDEGNDQISGGSENDELAGGEGNDQLKGDSGNDLLLGDAGSDNLDGGEGNDTISGGANNDWLQGSEGNDILTGGEGEDVLHGGDGADRFVFNSPNEGTDIIIDFNPGEGDKLVINTTDFGTNNLDDFQFIGGNLSYQDKVLAVIQNEGNTYNYFRDLSEIIELVEGEENITIPESPSSQEAPTIIEPTAGRTVQTRNSPGQPTNLLAEILERGYLKAAVLTDQFGFSVEEDGEWDGYGVEWARAIAAGLFGDPNRVEFTPVGGSSEAFEAVAAKEVDLATSNLNPNLLRDASLNVDFAPISIYDNRAVIVKADSNIQSVLDLEGKKVGLTANTTGALNFQTFMEANGIEYEPVFFESGSEMFAAYDSGLVDTFPLDRSSLVHIKETFSDPENHIILDEEIFKEAIAIALPENESEWADVVRWTTYAPIQAEEFGINSQNIEEFKANSDPAIRRFLGLEGELGQTLGVPNNFAENAIKAVGNYGELFERNFPGLKRNRNQIWQNGGLLYSPPFSGTIASDTELIDNDERGLLDEILERGQVKVGITDNNPGFAQEIEGEWEGFDTDLGRALAAALFGDADKVEFAIQSFSDGFPNVANGEVDVSAMGVSQNLVRDGAMGVDFSPTYLYTGQGILVRNDSGITSLPMLNGRKIGVVTGTTIQQNLEDALARVGGTFVPTEFITNDQLFTAYDNGEIDAVVTDLTILNGRVSTLSNPAEHRILDEVLSKEPLALVIDENQSDWGDVVRWVTHALVQAEELGITQDNVDELVANSTDPEIRRFLGVEDTLGEALGLPNDYAVQIIKAVGNYGEVYERNFDSNVLRRDANELFTDFGLQYAPPLGGNPISNQPTSPTPPPPTPISDILEEFFPQEDDTTEEEDDPVIEAADTTETEETDATISDGDGETDTTTSDEDSSEEGEQPIIGPSVGEDDPDIQPEPSGVPGAIADEIPLQPEISSAPEAIAIEDNLSGTPVQDGSNEAKVMLGTDIAETLLGGSGDDWIQGMRADDMLMGYEGDDTVYGGKGNDLVMGGADADILYGDNDDDTVSGEDGADMINGNRGQDVIDGGEGEDMLHGGKGSDLIQAGTDNDTLLGEKGNDSLEGNEGDDLLNGGVGDDTLVGGGGSDRFVLVPGNGIDIILDFEEGIDFLQLEGGLAFDQLTLTAESGGSVVELGDERLAVLLGVEPTLVNAEDFLS